MILNKFLGILYFLFLNCLNLKLSNSQNLHHDLNQISKNLNSSQKVEDPKPYYIIRKDNLVIGPIPSPFSIFYINQGYFGFDPNNVNSASASASASTGSNSNSGGGTETGNSKNSGNNGKSNSQGEGKDSKKNNPKFPKFSTTPKTTANQQQNQKPNTELTPPKMEDSQINRPNQQENFQPQPQPPLQQTQELENLPDPSIDNSSQIALLMATFLGGLLLGIGPLIVTQILLNASMILMQIMMAFQPSENEMSTTMHTLQVSSTPMSVPVNGQPVIPIIET